jgi:hypothetical protein
MSIPMQITLTNREADILLFAINFLKSNLDEAMDGIDEGTINESEIDSLIDTLEY